MHFLFSVICLMHCVIATVDPSKFDTRWDYMEKSEKGPEQWKTVFKNCSGVDQSPINIIRNDTQEQDYKELDFLNEQTKIFDLTNHGQFVSLDRKDNADNLQGIFFSWASEHQFDGNSSAFEFGLIYNDEPFNSEWSNPVNAKIVTILGELGTENPELKNVVEKLDSISSEGPSNSGKKVDVTINIANLLPSGKSYYQYEGSVPAPPCTKPVKVHVLEDKISLSEKQLQAFKNVKGVDGKEIEVSHRPTQNLGGRTVTYYGQK